MTVSKVKICCNGMSEISWRFHYDKIDQWCLYDSECLYYALYSVQYCPYCGKKIEVGSK